MNVVIVPNEVRDAIYQKVDKALEPVPQLKEKREEIYAHLLDHYDKTGVIADFKIVPDEELP